MKTPDQLLDSIRQAIGEKGCTTDPGGLEQHVTEMRGLWRGTCAMAVSPATIDEVSAVMSLPDANWSPISWKKWVSIPMIWTATLTSFLADNASEFLSLGR